MKMLETWKKVLLIILTVLVALRVGFVLFRGDTDKRYSVSTQYDLSDATAVSCEDISQIFVKGSEDRLNSLELYLADIPEDASDKIVLKIMSEDELIYQTNIHYDYESNQTWKKVFVNAEIKPDREYIIMISPDEESTVIPNLMVVNNDSYAPEIKQSLSGGEILDGQFAINYGYLNAPRLLDRLVECSLLGILWIVAGALIVFWDRLANIVMYIRDSLEGKVHPQILVAVSEIIGCLIIINCSGIEFQFATKIVLAILSLICSVDCLTRSNYVYGLAGAGWQKVLRILLYFYSAFALVGQRFFIHPLTLKITVPHLFVYICAVLWFIPIINSLLYCLEMLCIYLFSADRKIKTWLFVVICSALLIVPAIYNLYANNPAISSPDTVQCMIVQAQHLKGSENWHPAFYCMILRLIELVWNSPTAVVLTQYAFWLYVCLELLLYLRKKDIKESVLIVLALMLGGNAGNYLYLNTVWKDIPYTLSLFWTIIILAKLLIDYEEYKKKWYIYLELVMALIGVSLYRNNGIVAFVIILLLMVILLRENKKVWISALLSIALFATIKGPVYSYFDIQPIDSGVYIGLSQDILGVYCTGGEVSEDTLKMINVMTEYNNGEYVYNATWAYQSYDLAVDMKDFIICYIDTFIKNPVVMTRAIIDRIDGIWDIYEGKETLLGSVGGNMTMDDDELWRSNYAPRRYVSTYESAVSAVEYTINTQWIAAIEWRSGLFSLLGLVALFFMFLKGNSRKCWVLLAPAGGQILSLLLSTGWAEFRYFWPLNLLNTALIFFAIIVTREGTR